MNCFGRSGEAVGLSAISLLAPPHPPQIPYPAPVPHSPFPFPNPVPAWLAKDAAPIPNAFESTSLQVYKSTSQKKISVQIPATAEDWKK